MKPALWIALLASLGLSAWLAQQPDAADDDSGGLALAPRRATTLATTTASPVPQPLVAVPAVPPSPALPARAADWAAVPARALLAWGGAAPPATAAAAVARPAAASGPAAEDRQPRAPAFPYQWIGTLDDGRGAQALLGGALRGAAVRAGQVLDGQWRVERIREQQLELTWLPGGQSLTVRGGGTLAAGRPARTATDNDPPEAPAEPAS